MPVRPVPSPDAAAPSGRQRPLLVTADAALLDDVLRCAGDAGAEVDVVADLAAARPAWPAAPLVLVGVDRLDPLPDEALPRRAGVLVVEAGGGAPASWEVAATVGAEAVLTLPGAEPVLVERLTVLADAARGVTVAVLPGRGGAGATTVAVALARAAARGRRTLLLDADPWGGGIDLALGAESRPGLRWADLDATRGATGPDELRSALPTVDGLPVLAWSRHRSPQVDRVVAASVLSAARRGHDLVIADLPRQPHPVADAVLAVADVALVVVPADLRSVAAALVVADRVRGAVGDVRAVVRGPAPSGLAGPEVAAALGLRYAGWLAPEPGLAARVDRGEPPGAAGRGRLSVFCRALLADLPARRDPGRAA